MPTHGLEPKNIPAELSEQDLLDSHLVIRTLDGSIVAAPSQTAGHAYNVLKKLRHLKSVSFRIMQSHTGYTEVTLATALEQLKRAGLLTFAADDFGGISEISLTTQEG